MIGVGIGRPFATPLAPHGAPPAQSYLLHDTFTDPDGTLLTAHPLDTGQSWQGDTALADIQGNQLRFTADEARIYADAGDDVVALEILFTPAAGVNNRNSFLVRFLDASNFIQLSVRADAVSQDIFFGEWVGGNFFVRGMIAYSFTMGQTYLIRAEVRDDGMKMFVDGVERLVYSATLPHTGATLVGLQRNSGSNNTRIDDFRVSAL